MKIKFKLNGVNVFAEIEANMTLLDLLRDNYGLTGTKKGCETGECGACTVLIDGENINSCLVLAATVDNREVVTIEGLMKGGKLDPIQKAFIEKGAMQCGFCTPGMIMSVKALLTKNPSPSREEIKEGISGNLCRCTSYKEIIEAVEYVVKEGYRQC